MTPPAFYVRQQQRTLHTFLLSALLLLPSVATIMLHFRGLSSRIICDGPEVAKFFADDELLVQFIMDCSHEKIQRFLTLPLRWQYIFEPITKQWC